MELAGVERPPGKNRWLSEISVLFCAKSPVIGEMLAQTGFLWFRRKEEMIRLNESGCSTGGK
jgi:hypothetical protein